MLISKGKDTISIEQFIYYTIIITFIDHFMCISRLVLTALMRWHSHYVAGGTDS